MHTRILSSVMRHVQINEREIDFFKTLLKPRTIRKRQYLLQAGDICRYETFATPAVLNIEALEDTSAQLKNQLTLDAQFRVSFSLPTPRSFSYPSAFSAFPQNPAGE